MYVSNMFGSLCVFNLLYSFNSSDVPSRNSLSLEMLPRHQKGTADINIMSAPTIKNCNINGMINTQKWMTNKTCIGLKPDILGMMEQLHKERL